MSELSHEETVRLKQIERCGMVIPRKFLANEADLMVKKWPAYRFTSPMAATQQFRLDYIAAYRRSHRINVDRDEADKLKIAERVDFARNNSRLTQLWIARQQADELGMPYPVYLNFCFDFANRRKRKQPPQPNQLGPNPKTAAAWVAALAELWTFDMAKTELHRMECIPQYFLENDMGLPAQSSFRANLSQMAARPETRATTFIPGWVVGRRQFSETDCEKFFDLETIVQSMQMAKESIRSGLLEIQEYPDLTRVGKLQACFGVPGINTANEPVCANCSHLPICDRQRAVALESIASKTGHADPVEAKRLDGIRLRTQKSRDKSRLALGTSSNSRSAMKFNLEKWKTCRSRLSLPVLTDTSANRVTVTTPEQPPGRPEQLAET